MEMSSAAAAVGRKRKPSYGETELSSTTSSGQLKTRRLDVVITPENSSTMSSSGEVTRESLSCELAMAASCCSSNGLSTKFADLEEEENEETEAFATSAGNYVDFRDRREKTPSSEVQAESGELESTAAAPCHHRRSTAAIMPSEDELEEFFSAAEKNLQKQFIDKYNYDIAKDEPLEGRYEWVQIQIKP
ncbi:hypothetical protein BUALT_Bualt04G0113600 [Buddleja alternifolia]|uniref:Cyclin-dependent kinase inhibitor n=1 Tax=Buddleja alternifolia TaxID=168488 RepID=A0AAV6XSH4_9LAMI|nr:hypothetical protein BUALT_Bualt04G0113600 [Buddleja alternifolia]